MGTATGVSDRLVEAEVQGHGILVIRDMHCGGCVRKLEQALRELVLEFSPSVATRTLELRWDSDRVGRHELLRKVRRAGFSPRWLQQADDALVDRRAEMSRIAISGLLAMQVMMLAVPGYFGGVAPDLARLLGQAQWVLATPVVFYGGLPFLRGALRSLISREPTMDLPVGVAILLAWSASSYNLLRGAGELYFESAAMFVSLLSLGRWFEGRGRAVAAERINRLLAGQPRTARLLRGDRVETVPIATIVPGDRVEIPPGDAVPVDGLLETDIATLSEAVIHGESEPVQRQLGEEVPAGAINVGQYALQVRAVRVGADTTIGNISRLVHQALSRRPRFVRWTDRLAGWFIVTVLLLAAGSYLYWATSGSSQAFSIALAVLVASCPCALSLAIPVAVAASTGRLAQRGILVANAEALMRARDVDVVLFDKTGTLTEEKLQLQQVVVMPGQDADQVRRLAAGLERGSRHPVAQAFAEIHDPLPVADVRQQRDGVTGCFAGAHYRLQPLPPSQRPDGATADPQCLSWTGLYVCHQHPVLLAAFGLGSRLQSRARDAVDALASRAPELVSGDAEAPTRHIAALLGIERWWARCAPAAKVELVNARRAEGHCVAAVGDGINDSGYLAAADVAIAMGEGAALAQSAADIILLQGDLQQLPALFRESSLLHRRIAQNLRWAVGYNLVAFSAAASGLVVPWLAALGMAVSSLVVVANAIRRAGSDE